MEDRFPIIDILDQRADSDNCQWAMFLAQYDELTLEMVTDEERDYMWRVYATIRTRALISAFAAARALLAIAAAKWNCSTPCSFPCQAAHHLLRATKSAWRQHLPRDRNGCRTPMQWSQTATPFFPGESQQLHLPVIIDPSTTTKRLTSKISRRIYRRCSGGCAVIATRKNFRAFSRGSLEFFSGQRKVPRSCAATKTKTVLIVVNLSVAQVVSWIWRTFRICPIEVFSRNPFQSSRIRYVLTSAAFHYWFTLHAKRTTPHGEKTRGADAQRASDCKTARYGDACGSRVKFYPDIAVSLVGAKARTLRQMRVLNVRHFLRAQRRAILVCRSELS